MKAEIKPSPGVALAIRGLEKLPQQIEDVAALQLAKSLNEVAGIAMAEYLSGPRAKRLDVVTTRLRGSIATKVDRADGKLIGRIGSNVRYAPFHEFGLKGTVNVRAHTRVARVFQKGIRIDPRRPILDREGRVIGRKENTLAALARIAKEKPKQARGIKFTTQQVKAHTRSLDYAGKPFIAPALQKHLPLIIADLKAALSQTKPSNG